MQRHGSTTSGTAAATSWPTATGSSTNNEGTVPGRASEGCIRLLDKDIITLKEHFAYVGMPVTVQPEDQAPAAWEQRVRQAALK